VGWRSDLQGETPDAEEPEARWHGSKQYQEARFAVLPGQDRALLIRQYLNWTKNRPTPQCWWCRYPTQTREHLFKACPEWKAPQKILWAEVRKETGRWKDRWKIRDLLADERCSRAVLDFLSSTDVERWVPAEEGDAMSEVSEAELREWMEEPDAGGDHHCSYPRLTSWRLRERHKGPGGAFPLFIPLSFTLAFRSCVITLVRASASWDRPGRRAKGNLQRAATARTADRKPDCT